MLVMLLDLPGLALAQTSPAASGASTPSSAAVPSPLGWTGFEEVQYGAQPALGGNIIIEDTDLGYALTDHLTVDVGLPVIWSRSPFSPVINHDYYWSALLGEPYFDARYSNTYHAEIKYTSVLTATLPVGNEDKVFATGRVGVDWFNHVEEPLGKVTGFVNFGASNGAINRFIMPRPYSEARPYETLGLLGDAEAGAEYRINAFHVKNVGIGGSYYVLIPGGPQKVYSRYVFPYSVLAGDGQHHRYYYSTFETTGTSAVVGGVYGVPTGGLAAVDRDNGFSGWIDLPRWHSLDFQLSYTRSVHYLTDTYGLTITFDGQDLIRSLMPHR